jgi:hypothetical protein
MAEEQPEAGLKHLKAMTHLSGLDVRFTHVTKAGVKELQQALPELLIYR